MRSEKPTVFRCQLLASGRVLLRCKWRSSGTLFSWWFQIVFILTPILGKISMLTHILQKHQQVANKMFQFEVLYKRWNKQKLNMMISKAGISFSNWSIFRFHMSFWSCTITYIGDCFSKTCSLLQSSALFRSAKNLEANITMTVLQ